MAWAEPHWYRRGFASPHYGPSHRAFRDKIRSWVDAELMPHIDEWERAGKVPDDLPARAYAAGVWSPTWQPQLVGFTPNGHPEGLDAFHDLIWLDELARTGSSGLYLSFTIYTMALPPVLFHGSDYVRSLVVRDVIEGRKGHALCISEPWAGSDVAGLRTTATRDGDHWVVNGQKKWITNAAGASWFTVAVRTGGPGMKGLSLLLVSRSSPGVKVERMKLQGNWSAGTSVVTFEDVRVPANQMIGVEGGGFKAIVTNFNHERFVLAAQASRAARLCIQEAARFARSRRTFGQKLIDSQVIQHKLSEMGMRVEATHALLEQVAYMMKAGVEAKLMGGQVALLKVFATRTLEFCAREAAQILGGASYTRSGKGAVVERIYREARALAIYGGSEEILLGLAARQAKL